MSKTYVVPPASPLNHGKTPAAWVLMVGVVGGAIIAAIGFTFAYPVVLVIGVAVMVLATILSGIMRARGLGQKAPRAQTASQ